MKKTILVLTMAMAIGLTLYPNEGKTMMGGGSGMGSGMMGEGASGLGRGMMGGDSYGIGTGGGQGMIPGMNGPGYGREYGPQSQQPQKPLDKNDARGMVEKYLKSARNPNLHLGKIEDKGDAFEASVLTRDNSLADKMLIDKNTGSMRSVY